MQISIVNGIYSDSKGDLRTSYPRNLVPVPKMSGVSNGYLRPAEGIELFAELPGKDRGGINWNGECYRVAGNQLIRVSGAGVVETLGFIAGTGRVTFAYSFDRLAIIGGGSVYYYAASLNDGVAFPVTDPDLGTGIIDGIWIDGYFLLNDGEFLISTELSDPTSVNPLKYGSSEVDPDPIIGLKKLRNEAYAINRYTIEVFGNVGGSGFPFQRIDGAQITRGAVGTHACCEFSDKLAFLGGKLNEAISVWVAASGNSLNIATREIDEILSNYSEDVLSKVVVESRLYKAHSFLYVHLPTETLVYDQAASQAMKEHVWHRLDGGKGKPYRATGLVYCYNKWLAGDTKGNALGYLTELSGEQYDTVIDWSFDVPFIYNESRGGLIHSMQLTHLGNRMSVGQVDSVGLQFSDDGRQLSSPRFAKITEKRLQWRRLGRFKNYRNYKFTGTSRSQLSFMRLDAEVEGLNV